MSISFPPGFLWGNATASYQIEGAVAEDGRGPSIWDTFSHTEGKVLGGDTGDVAVDHYHRMPEDVALMGDLGLSAYRFSIAWPRIVPAGSGAVNRAGIDFYSRLIDELLARGITPAATLYHWDLPQPLEDAGGWQNRDTAARFAEYAAVVAEHLGDRLPLVITLNEPWCSAYLGYGLGVHAPGVTGIETSLRAAHHLNLAHGLGTSALRATLPASSQVAITLNLVAAQAASQDEADVRAAEHVRDVANRIFLDPIFRGHYPAALLADLRHVTDWSFVRDGDLAAIGVGADVLGVNYYTPAVITAGTDGEPYPGTDLVRQVPATPPLTAIGWTIEPSAFTDLLTWVHGEHPELPIMITENGAAFDDAVAADGGVHDAERIAYLDGHLRAVHDAIEQGVDVRGYFLWSLMDNFEWAWGFSMRFGIVYVDYATQQRIPKDSAHWYRDVIARNGLG
jgi:beta-glucosidase